MDDVRRVVVSTGAMAVLQKELGLNQASKDSVDELKKQGTGQTPKEFFSRKYVVAAHEKCKKELKDLGVKGLQGALYVSTASDRIVEEAESDDENEAAGGGPMKHLSVAFLKEIFLPQLEVNKNHHGRVLFGTLCVSPFQISSVMTVMADKSGKAVRVSVTNRRGLLTSKEMQARFGSGLKVAIKEPYLKMCPDNMVAIKVEDASHFVHVDDSNNETLSELEATIESLDKIRKAGNTLFSEHKWIEAIEQYTVCIKRCNDLCEGPHQDNDKIKQCLLLAYSNRSEAYLQLADFKHALDDANMALEYDASHQKSISRRDRAWLGFGKVQVSASKGKLSGEESREPCFPDSTKEAVASETQLVHPPKSDATVTKNSTSTDNSSEAKPSSVSSRSASPSQSESTDTKDALPTGDSSEAKAFREESTSPMRRTQRRSVTPSKSKGAKHRSVTPSKSKGAKHRSVTPSKSKGGKHRSITPSKSKSGKHRSVTPPKSKGIVVKASAAIVDSSEEKRSRRNSRSPSRSQTGSKAQRALAKDLLAAPASSKQQPSEFVADAKHNGTSHSKSKLDAVKPGPTEVKAESSKGKQAATPKRKGSSVLENQASGPQSTDVPSTGNFKPKSDPSEDDGSKVAVSDGKGTGKRGHNSSSEEEKVSNSKKNTGIPSQSLDGIVEGVENVGENKRSDVSSESGLRGEEITESRKNYSPQRLKGKHVLADENVARALLPQGSKSKATTVTESINMPNASGSADLQREPLATVDHEGPLFATWLDSIRSSGDLLLNEGKWADAIVKYDKVTKVSIPKRNRDRVIQTILQAVSHRSEAWIWLGNYENSLRDADFALELMDRYHRSVVDYEAEYLLNEVRRGRAFYGLGEYDKSCAIFAAALEASPYEKSISDLLGKSRICFEQSRNGIYNLDNYFLSACDTPPPPCSDYVGPIEIRSIPGKGRGLFLTRDVHAGDLLLVSNPLAVIRRRLNRPVGGGGKGNDEESYRLLTSKWRRNVTTFGLDEFIGRLAISQSARKTYQLYSLAIGDAGDEAEVPDINAFIVGSRFELPKGWSIPESEEYLRSIVIWNAIDGGLNPLVGTTSKSQDREEISCVGLWALPSFMNHSCAPNCHMIDVGNAMFVRASCNIEKGEELTRAYFDVFQNGLYRQRISKEEWDFICNCKRCTLEQSLTIQRVLPLHEYRTVLDTVMEELRRRNESGEKERALSLLLPNPNPAHLKLRKFGDSFDRVLFSADGLTCKEKAWIGASYLEAYVSRFVGSKERSQLVLALENILDFMTNTAVIGAGEAQTTLARASFLLQEIVHFHGAGSQTHRRIELRVLDLYATAYGKLGKEILLAMSQTMANSGKAFTGLIDVHLRWESRSPLHYLSQGNSLGALALRYH